MRSSLAALLCCTIGLCISVIALSKDLDAKPEYYFWNEVTGETQWDDPGDVPYETEDGRRYWLTPEGEKTDVDPTAHRYVWVEQWSGEHQRSYFYNQETGQSTWEKPADMAWRRIRAKHDEL